MKSMYLELIAEEIRLRRLLRRINSMDKPTPIDKAIQSEIIRRLCIIDIQKDIILS